MNSKSKILLFVLSLFLVSAAGSLKAYWVDENMGVTLYTDAQHSIISDPWDTYVEHRWTLRARDYWLNKDGSLEFITEWEWETEFKDLDYYDQYNAGKKAQLQCMLAVQGKYVHISLNGYPAWGTHYYWDTYFNATYLTQDFKDTYWEVTVTGAGGGSGSNSTFDQLQTQWRLADEAYATHMAQGRKLQALYRRKGQPKMAKFHLYAAMARAWRAKFTILGEPAYGNSCFATYMRMARNARR